MRAVIGCINVIKRFEAKMAEDRVDAYSAQSAFFVLMGFIPFIMLLLTLLQYTPLSETDMMSMLEGIFPRGLHVYIADIVGSLYNRSSAIVSGTALAALWASGKAMVAITKGLNTINGIEVKKNYFLVRIRGTVCILFLLLALVLAIGLFVFGNLLHDLLLRGIPWLRSVSWLLISVRTVGTIVVLSLVFCAMYSLLPYGRKPFRTQITGAVTAAFAWSVFSYGFSIYIQYSRNMAAIYGSLTTIVLVMLWLYSCMWLLFLGAEINSYLEGAGGF